MIPQNRHQDPIQCDSLGRINDQLLQLSIRAYHDGNLWDQRQQSHQEHQKRQKQT